METKCEYPDCPTKDLVETLKNLTDKLAGHEVFKADISYIREMVDKIDKRTTKDLDNLFERMRKVEAEKVGKLETFAAIGATGTIVGIVVSLIK